jgi:hypothetical protein
MCCLFSLAGILGPRIALVIWWIVNTSLFDRVFSTVFWPIVGIIFAPWTTLFYVIAWWASSPQGQLSGWGYFLIVIGILFDVASQGGGLWRGRKRWGYSR